MSPTHVCIFALALATSAPLCTTAAEIRLAKDATTAEITAARELAEHIAQMTGETPEVKPEGTPTSGSVLFVGQTKVAAQAGIKTTKLGSEEWIVKSVGEGLVLTGGRPRGTLYAVYHYLEDVCGVRWWSPWEQTIPKLERLKLINLDLRGKPTLQYRDFFWSWIIQLDIDSAGDVRSPDAQFEIWARIKFTGPEFPHGKPDEPNAICVERVVLVKQTSRQP